MKKTADGDLVTRDPGVHVDEEGVYIWDDHGEVVMWHRDEWKEDPEVVFSIIGAIEQYHREGPSFMRKGTGKEISGTKKQTYMVDLPDADRPGEFRSEGPFTEARARKYLAKWYSGQVPHDALKLFLTQLNQE